MIGQQCIIDTRKGGVTYCQVSFHMEMKKLLTEKLLYNCEYVHGQQFVLQLVLHRKLLYNLASVSLINHKGRVFGYKLQSACNVIPNLQIFQLSTF